MFYKVRIVKICDLCGYICTQVGHHFLCSTKSAIQISLIVLVCMFLSLLLQFFPWSAVVLIPLPFKVKSKSN